MMRTILPINKKLLKYKIIHVFINPQNVILIMKQQTCDLHYQVRALFVSCNRFHCHYRMKLVPKTTWLANFNFINNGNKSTDGSFAVPKCCYS